MNPQQIKPKAIIRFLWNLRHTAPISSIAMIGCQILFVLISTIVAPIFVAKLLALISSGSVSWQSASHLLIFYAGTLIMGDIIMARLSLLFIYIGETKMQAALSRRIFDNITQKDLRFHSDNMSGEVISNTTKLISALENFWDLLVFNVTPIITVFVATVVALSIIFWQYAVIVAVLTIVFSIVIAKAQNKVAPVSRQVAKHSSKITGHFADVVTNMAAVKAFANEKTERTLHDGIINSWHKVNYKEGYQVLKVTTVFSIITTFLNVMAFVVAIVAAQKGLANIATIYLVVSYTLSIVEQLWTINRVTRNYVRIIGNAAPMLAMLETPTTILDSDNPEPLTMHSGRVQFSNVSFSYPDNGHELLFSNLNLTIKPGEKIGLVGKSGGGKTTLSKLLLRFMDINDGQILIDGQDIKQVRQNDLRSKIAYVPQEPLLFHRSITDNISYGQAGSTQQEIETVAKMAHAHEFIVDLPKGYKTLVGERGVKLSGGQRQRIAIARAMLKNAPILLLDEATSALDSESEVLIQDALWKLMEGRTAIVIAHRLSTIQKMDRIIVLDDGKIIEEGSHKELISKDGTYAKLWNHQSGGFIEE